VRGVHLFVMEWTDTDVDARGDTGCAAAGCELCVRSRKTSVAVDVMRYPQSALIPSKNPTAWVRFASDRYI
jgi:hypothetical protein